MSLCPICKRSLCDHTEEERNQTSEEMMRPLTKDEIEIVKKNNKNILRLSFDGAVSLKYDEIDKIAERISKKIDIPKEKAKIAIEMGIFEGFMMNRYRRIDLKSEGED